MRRAPSTGGFTLLELMLALMLATTVGLAVSGTLRAMHAARERSRELADERAREINLERFLRRDLGEVVRVDVPRPPPREELERLPQCVRPENVAHYLREVFLKRLVLLDQVVHSAGGHALHISLLDHG